MAHRVHLTHAPCGHSFHSLSHSSRGASPHTPRVAGPASSAGTPSNRRWPSRRTIAIGLAHTRPCPGVAPSICTHLLSGAAHTRPSWALLPFPLTSLAPRKSLSPSRALASELPPDPLLPIHVGRPGAPSPRSSQSPRPWPNHSLKQPAAARRAPDPLPLGGPPSAAQSSLPGATIPASLGGRRRGGRCLAPLR